MNHRNYSVFVPIFVKSDELTTRQGGATGESMKKHIKTYRIKALKRKEIFHRTMENRHYQIKDQLVQSRKNRFKGEGNNGVKIVFVDAVEPYTLNSTVDGIKSAGGRSGRSGRKLRDRNRRHI